MQNFSDVMITQVSAENSSVASISMEPVPEAFRRAEPGQYLLVRLQTADGWSEPHPFTITSAPGDGAVRITVKKVGPFTTALHASATPAPAQIHGPLGSFGASVPAMKAGVFIAGGIGITPYISILETMCTRRSRAPVVLFWANVRDEDFFYRDLFKKYTQCLDLRIVMIVNELPVPDESGDGRISGISGFLTTSVIEKYVSEQVRHDSSWFLCGSPGMQQYVFSQLSVLGILPESVTVERVGQFMAGIK